MSNLISTQSHPYQEDLEIAVSQVLEKNRSESLCYHCYHKKNSYKDCQIAKLLYDLAIQTGVSTLVRWCPTSNFKLNEN